MNSQSVLALTDSTGNAAAALLYLALIGAALGMLLMYIAGGVRTNRLLPGQIKQLAGLLDGLDLADTKQYAALLDVEHAKLSKVIGGMITAGELAPFTAPDETNRYRPAAT